MKIKEKWVSWEEFYKIQSGIFSPAAHSHISSEVGGLTLGSIPFADAAGVLVEDNTELFWDSGTDMMGIGGAPSAKLDVYGDVMVGHAVTGTIHFKDVAGNQVAFIQNVGGIIHVDADSDITLDPNNTERLRLLSAGNMAFGVTAVGANAVKVFGIGSGTAPTTSPANMVQLWVEDRGAGYAQLHYRAEGGLTRPLIREFDVSDYGLIPDDITKKTANVTAFRDALLPAMSTGDVIYFPKGTWYIDDDLDVTKSVVIRGDGSTVTIIKQETAGKKGFDVTLSGTLIKDLGIEGTGGGVTSTAGSHAIHIHGVDADNYIINFKVIDVRIENWKQYGILTEWIENFEFAGNWIDTITYAGMMILSSRDGRIHHNHINTISGNAGEGYGIAVSRYSGTLATYPRAAHLVIDNNIVEGVSTWEGLDVHGGQDISYNNNVVINCKRGIMIGTDSDDNPSLNCHVIGNIIDSEQTDGSYLAGIVFHGFVTTPAYSTGSIIGNIIKGYGDEGNAINGGIVVYATQGLIINNNTIEEPSPYGIILSSCNKGFEITGNTIVDPWTDTLGVGEADGIVSDSTNNVGYIGGNSFIRCSRVADYTLDDSTWKALRIDNSAGTDIVIGNNYSEATTYVSDPGNFVKSYFPTNVGIGTATFGANMVGGLAMKNATAPTGNVADCFQMYSADFAGGNACPYFRTENGTVVGLNQSLLTSDSPVFLEVVSKSDNAKFILQSAAGAERAFLHWDESGSVLNIDSDSEIIFLPNNAEAGRFLADGTLQLGEISLLNDQIWDNSDNEGGAIQVNYVGKDGGVTQFKNLGIYDGKNNRIAAFTGSTGDVTFDNELNLTGDLGIGAVAVPGVRILMNRDSVGANIVRLISDSKTTGNEIAHYQMKALDSDNVEQYYAVSLASIIDATAGAAKGGWQSYVLGGGSGIQLQGAGGGVDKVKLPNIATTDTGDYDLRYDAADGIVYNTSDIRQKSNQVPLEYGLTEILKLQPKSYLYHKGLIGSDLDEKTRKRTRRDIEITDVTKQTFGLIAQDVYDVIPEIVFKPEDETKAFWGLRDTKLIPILINAIKELNAKVEALEA